LFIFILVRQTPYCQTLPATAMYREERKKLKQKYQDAFMLTRKIVNELDPMGLITFTGPDEYDLEVSEILARLKDQKTEQEIEKMVIAVFKKWFDDAGDETFYTGIGQKLMQVKMNLDEMRVGRGSS
jgi:hypothetical protein